MADIVQRLKSKANWHTKRFYELMSQHERTSVLRWVKRGRLLSAANSHRRCANFYTQELVKCVRVSGQAAEDKCDLVMSDLEKLLK